MTDKSSRPARCRGKSVALGTYTQTVRAYVRPAGQPLLATPRRYLGEFRKGSACIPLQDNESVFEFVCEDLSTYDFDAKSPAADAQALNSWIEDLSHIVRLVDRSDSTREMSSNDAVNVKAWQSMSALSPMWLVADQPVLKLVLPGAGDIAGMSFLPIVDRLCVARAETGSVRTVDSDEFVKEFGASSVMAIAEHIAAAFSAWDGEQRNVETARRENAAARDHEAFEAARKQISVVTADAPFHVGAGAAADSLLTSLNIIAARDRFTIVEPANYQQIPTLQQRLRRTATESNFRFREVEIQGRWWLEEGLPILLRHADGESTAAAIWHDGSYCIVDPETGAYRKLDEELASPFAGYGFMLYPCLSGQLSGREFGWLALKSVGPDVRTLLVSGLLAVLAGLIVPIATGVIVSTAIPDGRPNLVTQMAIMIGIGAISTTAFTVVRSLASIRASGLIDIRLQPALWDRALRLPSSFFRDYATGDLAMRVLTVTAMRRIIAGPVLNGLLSGAFASVSFILMLVYDVQLALYGFGFAVLSGLFFIGMARQQLGFQRLILNAQGVVTSRVLDMLSGISKLRVAGAEERAFARWADSFSTQERVKWASGRIRAMQSTAAVILPSVGVLGMLLVAGYRTQTIDLASFAAFNAAFGQFIASVAAFSLALGATVEAMPLLDRVKPILETEPEVVETRVDPGKLRGQVSIRDLTFRYTPDGADILDGVDFTIEPGEFVAVVGPSGSGKSTLLRLLLGFEAPLSGAVFYDNKDLAQLDLRLVRRQIGTVMQNASLIPGNLYDNIAGAAALSEEEVMEAAEMSGLADDIRKLPMGLDTFVTEEAGTLSGGQRQRTMIARALVRKPNILFFDEATSALDNRTQAIIADSLNKLKVTRLVIAHRLSTIRDADKIVVISQGKMVEVGNYATLMKKKGEFYRLAKRQLL